VDWDELYLRWSKSRCSSEVFEPEVRTLLLKGDEENVPWLTEALADKAKRDFVGVVLDLKNCRIPAAIIPSMVRAAVCEYEGRNEGFIRPCLRTVGRRRVYELLCDHLEHGTEREKLGAANALYWSRFMSPRGEKPFPEEPMEEVLLRRNCLLLREFVANEDVEIRRIIIRGLNLAFYAFPREMKPLIVQAIRIARMHPDEYIRRGIGIQNRDEGTPRFWGEHQNDIPTKSRNLEKSSSRSRRRFFT
jgi:hypothetical protein